MEATRNGDADGSSRLLLERQVCFRLYVASNLVTRLYRQHLDAMGLTYPQYLVMLILWEVEPQSVGQLGERLHLDSGTLTPLLKRMETAGLVQRRRDTADERRVLVALTETGRALRGRADAMLEALAQETCLSPGDFDELGQQLDQYISDLEEQLGT
ncbi:MarR family transcriptional regulator [Novosphingobium sp. FGD1]|jgi:DNA-binding MarR family transcriptional regulator|uniref:MarR family transcriptional regulator n=1 Tax=Novosphingobium silvae TaxID=2692619 RepID=A0A7X4GD29_9SPHN|nr:MarR family transcriptional regulator [Novosphingobium silvae]MYL96402.1 MarR family transcriptional regulator [Novosphingobium silvae]